MGYVSVYFQIKYSFLKIYLKTMDSLNLSCEEENVMLSQIAHFEELKYADFLNFGDDDENKALSQFVDNIERNLPTINLMDLNSEALSNPNGQNESFNSDMPKELIFDVAPNVELEEPDFQLTQDIETFVDNLQSDINQPNTDPDFLNLDSTQPDKQSDSMGKSDSNNSRFGTEITEEEIKNRIEQGIPPNTRKLTKWAFNLFNAWRNVRNENICGNSIPELNEFDVDCTNKWLGQFFMEVRKQNGELYPAKTLYLLASGILRKFREFGCTDMNFLSDSDDRFLRVRKCLDSQMKWVTQQGIGSEIKQAAPVTASHEDKMWSTGVFGYDSAKQLQNAVFFYNCKLFGMRAKDEHYPLETSQITVGVDDNGSYIHYVGRTNKTFQVGLKHMKVDHKNIKRYTNDESERNIIRLYQTYISSLETPGIFYRRPLKGNSLKFGKQRLGINKLESMIKTICKDAGISGNFTNQSGKRTCATTLYQAGVDEQSIMMRTGHRSVQGVRKYKWPSNNQLKEVSNILDPPKSSKLEDVKESPPVIPDKLVHIDSNTKDNYKFETCEENKLANFKTVATNPAGQFYNCVFNFGSD